MSGVDYRILGSLEAVRDGEQLSLGGAKQRALLAVLLVNANRVVTTDVLVEALWPEKAPGRPLTAIQGYVSHLRRALAPDRPMDVIVTEPAGYRLPVAPDSLDADRFETLLEEGRAARQSGDARSAKDALAAALSLFRGPPLADFTYNAWASGEIGRLEDLRLTCLEERIEADLALGRHGELVGELEALIADHPVRERLRGQLMIALYRSGRQSEALSSYQATRETLVEELGIEPAPWLQALHRQVLTQDPELAAPQVETARDVPLVRLPSAATPLVGRELELEGLVELLRREDVRLVTLTGPGGTGKTRLALEAAVRIAPGFRDGAHWISLAPLRDPGFVLPTIARAISVTEQAESPPAELLAQALSGRDVLLVLDNAEHLMPEVAHDVALVRDVPGPTFVVTSRERLNVQGEVVVPVPALVEREARELFVARAGAAGVVLDEEGLDELCRRLDHLPLALELAAARTPLFTPAQLLERLGDRLDLLVAARDADPRQRTLRATIDWSYGLLDADEQRLFRSLSVFAGGCTFERASEVCAAAPDAMQSLLEKSLLRRRDVEHGARYWMLETIREYAEQLLEQSGEAAVIRQRHADVAIELAERAEPELRGPDQASWLERLEAEYDNFRTALAWLLETDPGSELRLAAALRRFWVAHSRLREGRRWYEAGLERAADVDAVVRAKALKGAGNVAMVQGDYAIAAAWHEESLALRRELSDEAGIAGALANLGLVAAETGELERARELLGESLARHRALEDTWGAAMCLNNLGLVALYGGEHEQAIALYDESLHVFRELGDELGVADSLLCKGRACLSAGDALGAAELFSESLALSGAFGDKWALAECLEGVAAVAATWDEAHRAAELFGAAESLRIEIGAPLSQNERARFTELESAVRLGLGADGEELAREEGRKLSLDDAIRLAHETITSTAGSATTA